jgi:hypothetical protein
MAWLMGVNHNSITNGPVRGATAPAYRSAGLAESDFDSPLPSCWYLLPVFLVGSMVWATILWMVS